MNEIIEFIFNQNKILKFIVDELSTKEQLKKHWIFLQKSDKDGNELYSLSRKLGYIKPSEKLDVESFANDIYEFLKKLRLQDQNLNKGVINYLLFLNRLDCDNETEFFLLKHVVNLLTIAEFKAIILDFVNFLNEEYLLNYDVFEEIPETAEDWQKFILQMSFVSYFDDPLELLSSLLYIKPELTKEVLINANAKVKGRLISYKNELVLSEEDFRLIIASSIENKVFILSLLIGRNYSPINYNLIDLDIWNSMIGDWGLGFKSTLHNLYGEYTLSDDKKLNYLKNLTVALLTKSLDEGQTDELFVNLLWPDDFVPFSGLFKDLNVRDEKLDKIIYSWYVKKFIEYLKFVHENRNGLVLNDTLRYKNDFRNIFNHNSQYCLAYTLYSCLSVDNNLWNELILNIKKVVYDIKLFYYGSFNSQYVAKLITENLLLVFLSINNFDIEIDNQVKMRMNEYISLLKDIVLFPYIRLSEKNDIVWDIKSYEKHAAQEGKIYLINEYLSELRSKDEKRALIQELFDSWELYRTTIWPWMREKEPYQEE